MSFIRHRSCEIRTEAQVVEQQYNHVWLLGLKFYTGKSSMFETQPYLSYQGIRQHKV